MKKQLSGGVVAGILVVIGIIVIVIGWKVLAPPGPPTPNLITKDMLKDREKTMDNIKADQMRRAAAFNAGKQ